MMPAALALAQRAYDALDDELPYDEQVDAARRVADLWEDVAQAYRRARTPADVRRIEPLIAAARRADVFGDCDD